MSKKLALFQIETKIPTPEVRDVAQPGSAPQWGCGGRKFESSHPDQIFNFSV